MNAAIESAFREAREKLEGRLSHLDESEQKARTLLDKVQVEQREVRSALAKLDATTGQKLTPAILEALEEGPRTREQLLDAIGCDRRRLSGTLTQLVRQDRLKQDGEVFSL